MTDNPLLLDVPEQFKTERLLVRVPRVGEAEITNAAIRESASEISRWLSWAMPTQTIDETEARNRRAQAEFIARDYFHFHIYRQSDALFLGGISLAPRHWEIPAFEIGYWLRTSQTGQGYMTEAVKGLIQFAREHLQARRIIIMCDARNRASASVAERAGLTLEAHTHRDFRDTAGQLADSLLYAWNSAEPDAGHPPKPHDPIKTNPILIDFPEHLETERLILRPTRAGDGPMVYPVVRSSLADLQRWMPWVHNDYSVEEAEDFARRSAVEYICRESLHLRMMHRADDRFIGMVGLFDLRWDIPSGEIGYWLNVDYQGKGYMTEAVNRLTAFAFADLKLGRVEIHCNAANDASANVARRCGYVQEAHFRNYRRDVQGQLADTLVFARLRGDSDG